MKQLALKQLAVGTILCENRFFQMVAYFHPFAESEFGDAAERSDRWRGGARVASGRRPALTQLKVPKSSKIFNT